VNDDDLGARIEPFKRVANRVLPARPSRDDQQRLATVTQVVRRRLREVGRQRDDDAVD
jgi:hypothetical protein